MQPNSSRPLTLVKCLHSQRQRNIVHGILIPELDTIIDEKLATDECSLEDLQTAISQRVEKWNTHEHPPGLDDFWKDRIQKAVEKVYMSRKKMGPDHEGGVSAESPAPKPPLSGGAAALINTEEGRGRS